MKSIPMAQAKAGANSKQDKLASYYIFFEATTYLFKSAKSACHNSGTDLADSLRLFSIESQSQNFANLAVKNSY